LILLRRASLDAPVQPARKNMLVELKVATPAVENEDEEIIGLVLIKKRDAAQSTEWRRFL